MIDQKANGNPPVFSSDLSVSGQLFGLAFVVEALVASRSSEEREEFYRQLSRRFGSMTFFRVPEDYQIPRELHTEVREHSKTVINYFLEQFRPRSLGGTD